MSAVRGVGVLYNGLSMNQAVGRLIRKARLAKGLTQCALAEQLGTVAHTVSRWEAGIYEPTLEQLYWIAWACDMKNLATLLPLRGRVRP